MTAPDGWTPHLGELVTGTSRSPLDGDPVGQYAGTIRGTVRIQVRPGSYERMRHVYVDADTLRPAPAGTVAGPLVDWRDLMAEIEDFWSTSCSPGGIAHKLTERFEIRRRGPL